MSKTVTLRMDDRLYKKLRKLAERDNRTLSNYIETTVKRHIESEQFADDAEMAEIRGNKALNESMERSLRDYKAGRGRFV